MKLIFLLFLFISTLFSKEKELIIWLVNDVPPFYINNEKQKDQGFGDLIQNLLIKELNDYNHKITHTTLQRVMKDFKYGKKVCFSTWIYDSTKDIAITSIPNVYYTPLGIIIKKGNKKFLKEEIISLDNLLNNKGLIFGKAKARGYDKEIEQIVQKYKNQKNFVVRSSSQNPTEGIFNMIKRDRIDYTIDYYSTLSYYNINHKEKEELIFLPILENYKKGTLGAIACSKTAWGEKVIKDINEAIKNIRSKIEYKNILKKWLVPVGEEKDYWQNYNMKIEHF